jgi:hypothetical protein
LRHNTVLTGRATEENSSSLNRWRNSGFTRAGRLSSLVLSPPHCRIKARKCRLSFCSNANHQIQSQTQSFLDYTHMRPKTSLMSGLDYACENIFSYDRVSHLSTYPTYSPRKFYMYIAYINDRTKYAHTVPILRRLVPTLEITAHQPCVNLKPVLSWKEKVSKSGLQREEEKRWGHEAGTSDGVSGCAT